MSRSWLRLIAGLFAAMLLSFAPRAEACGGGGGNGDGSLVALGILVAAPVLVADVVFPVYDVVVAAQGEPPKLGLAITETALGGAQLMFGAQLLNSGVRDSTLTGFMLWTGAMTVHGIYGIAAATNARAAASDRSGASPGDAPLTTRRPLRRLEDDRPRIAPATPAPAFSFRWSPAPVTDGVAFMPGIVAIGQF